MVIILGAESFDCCSSFKKCSDALECVHKDNPIFDTCTYRKKLESGIVFYGKNQNIFEPIRNGVIPSNIILKKKDTVKTKEKHRPRVYLTCYKAPFAILSRSNTYSYKLNEDQASELTEAFINKEIPFITSIGLLEDLPGDTVEVDGPCNSRVVFKINGNEYHILNFNSYLIQNWFAEKIRKSFISKGIECRVELIGPYSGAKSEINTITKSYESTLKRGRAVKDDNPSGPTQLTLFDLNEVASPAYRRR